MKTNLSENAKAIVSSRGQVVIPKNIRKALDIHDGTELIFSVEDDGSLLLKPVKRSLLDFFGCLKRPGEKALSVEEMDEAIEENFRQELCAHWAGI